MYLKYCCDRCHKAFRYEDDCLVHEECCSGIVEQNNSVGNLTIKLNAQITGVEDIKKTIQELEEKLKNLKIELVI